MDIVWKKEGSPLPLPSLHLLVPPVRLMSAFMWHVAQRHHVMQYDKLAEFISLVTEIVPELLSCGQRAQLVMGLRARLVLELCRDDGLANLHTIQSHLDKIHACTADLSSSHQQTSMEVLKTSYTNFANLVQKLLNVPFEKEYFFQEVFPTNYGSAYDQTLQQLVSEFLSRLEQLLPAPDYTQTAAWLAETTAVAEEFGQHLSEPFALKTLLLYHRQLGTLSTGPSCSQDDIILSTLALPPEFDVEKFSVLYSGDEDYEEEGLAMLDSEDKDSSQSSDTGSEDLLPTKKSGPLAKLFICPQCSFAHQVKRKVQEHIQREHQMRITLDGKESAKKGRRRAEQKKKDLIIKNKKVHKQKSDSQRKWEHKRKDTLENKRESKRKKEDNSENKKEQCNQKELSADDRRFLSTRAVNKNFTEEETKCPKCDKVFELPNQLKTHLKLHTLPYHCSQCEKGFTSKSGYYQHQRVHKKGRIFVCSHCNKGFLCTYSLKQHELMHTEGPSHLCTVCGKRFSKVGIVRHMRMHKGEKNYLCTTCGKSFLSSGELLLHTRSHTRETPYTCTHCGKGFTNASHLNVHVRSHTGERPYLCSQCPKRFITLNCLKRHMLCHDGVKPYKCSNCGKEFTQQGNLKRHLTTHQPDT